MASEFVAVAILVVSIAPELSSIPRIAFWWSRRVLRVESWIQNGACKHGTLHLLFGQPMRQYELDYRKLRFVELVRMFYPRSVLAALIWIPLKLGVMRWQQIIPCPDSGGVDAVSMDALPEPARSHVRSVLPQFAESGYVDPLFECLQSSGLAGEVTRVAVRMRHESGSHLLRSLFGFATGGARQTQEQLLTFLPDSATTGTTNARPTFDHIPRASETYHPGKTLHELVEIHQRKLVDLADQWTVLRDRSDMIREVDALSDRYFAHMVHRGVMREIKS
jgi:hypothetical protein